MDVLPDTTHNHEDIKTKEDCCFNRIIGLPRKEKKRKEKKRKDREAII
ncbi:MAG TPA: hypothetical protein VE573_01580 [Nitrososphaeraceae archaeon]|nr:hypothetical protein [Nitrososphaeraceae archaeon]